MPFDGFPVAAGHGTGEGGGRTEFGDVVDARRREIEVRLEGYPDPTGDAFDLPEEGHEMIGRHRCSSVIQSAIPVRDDDMAAPQVIDRPLHDRIAGDREPSPVGKASSAHLRIRQGDQRMKRRTSAVRGEDLESQTAGEVGDDGVGDGEHLRCDVGYRCIRRGDDDEIDTAGGTREVVAPSEIGLPDPPGPGEGEADRSAGATRSDDAKPCRSGHGRTVLAASFTDHRELE